MQHAVRLGVVDDDLPQLHAVRFGELNETEHVREGVRAAVAGASLVDADAAWPQALSERPEGSCEYVRRRCEGDGAGWARQLEEMSWGEQAGCVANGGVQHAVEQEREGGGRVDRAVRGVLYSTDGVRKCDPSSSSATVASSTKVTVWPAERPPRPRPRPRHE